MGIYDTIQSISKESIGLYLAIIFGVIFFVSKVLFPSFANVTGLVAGLAIVYYLNDKKKSTASDYNKKYEIKLNSLIPRPVYFHIDPDLIDIFYNTRDFRQLNREAYDNALKTADNVLRIEVDAEKGLFYCQHHFDVAQDNYTKSLNHYHSLIFNMKQTSAGSLPVPKLRRKYQRALKDLQIVLRRHLDRIYKLCEKFTKRRPINITTQIRYNRGPYPDDTRNADYLPNYNVYR